ncbi:nitrate- and nitrite sensing domain-containing protein [Isoptericola sp. b490]|uniref:sensor histidine kinase n=1 Tax=Actinotalea lenta TaxID=3064654 RepID=UPI002712E87E|nr:nitrate- and nitrite sensing domain-containing protein [Isoptericola sp. b490]MDO8122312.1 nitrate- and nitrite sensing domain-containing protein [Isoptericola sp. b490]
MFRRFGIRGKILAALSVPVLVLFVLAGALSFQAVNEARTARASKDLVDTLALSRQLTSALQDERALSDRLFGPSKGTVRPGQLESQRKTTDAAIKRLSTSIDALDKEALDSAVGGALETVSSQLGILDSARSLVDAGQVALTTVDNTYASLLHAIASLPKTVAEAIGDRPLAKIISTNADVSLLIEGYRHELVLGQEVLAGERSAALEQSLLSLMSSDDDLRLELSAELYDFNLEHPVTEVALATEPQSYGAMRTAVTPMKDSVLNDLQPSTWASAAYKEIGLITPAQVELDGRATARADTVSADAQRQAILTVVLASGAVLLSVIIALAIARSIALPVRRLTAAAASVRDRLPSLVEQAAVPGQTPDLSIAEIPVTSHDEVGRLADAFNDVNSTTLRIAQEQAALRGSIAEMFVNVARRDQVLLNRQLTFIDALERSEEDPATLADLFRLDHLATRMRRNAESLLVLAGIDTGRKLRETLLLSDVIRTASSEIEHYERVQIDLPVDPRMLGHTSLPAAHLLAELLENATMFSEPGSPVHVSTGRDDTHVLIAVVDQGLGMTDAERAEAQAKIESTSASDVLGAQRLGLFVVGRIAARLGAKVTLEAGPNDRGTRAVVRLPLALFVDVADLPMHQPAQPETASEPEPAAPTAEPEEARPVDLAALTDGATGRGLPRRRTVRGADSAAEAPSERPVSPTIPAAPAADALTGAAASGGESAWTPVVEERYAPLAQRRVARGAHVAGEATAPVVEPAPPVAPGELPSRRPGGAAVPPPPVPAAPAAGATADPADAAKPSSPQDRASMFSGFRSRRAEMVAASLHVESHPEPEVPAESDDAPEPEAPALEQDQDQEDRFVIPLLEPDEDDYPPSASEQRAWAQASGLTGPDAQDWASDTGWPPAPQQDTWAPDDGLSWPPAVQEESWTPAQQDEDSVWLPGSDQEVWAPAFDEDQPSGEPPVPAAEPAFADPVPEPAGAPLDGASEPPQVTDQFAAVPPAEPATEVPALSLAPADASGWTDPAPSADFTALVQGAPAASEKPKRRGLFRRRPKPEPVVPAAPPAAVDHAAPTAQAWAPEPQNAWAPADTRPSTDATQTFADLAASAPEPAAALEPMAPEPQPDQVPSEPAAPRQPEEESRAPDVPQRTSAWLPQEEPEFLPSRRLPSPGEQDWPAARAGQPSAAADVAAEAPPTDAEDDAARHAKPLVPSQHAYATFTPAEDSNPVLAQRAGIAQQALAELSQLSTYRPQVGPSSAPLTRRNPTQIPQAPALSSRRPAGTPRDANQVRSLLASFQSGTSRGREAADSDAAATESEVTHRGL